VGIYTVIHPERHPGGLFSFFTHPERHPDGVILLFTHPKRGYNLPFSLPRG